MNEFTSQFLVEARELAEQASKDLLALEERPGDRELLEGVFRGFHTLKGAAGIMEYVAMERLLHRAEDTLQQLRVGERKVEPALIDALLATVGQLMRWFDDVEQMDAMPPEAAADADRMLRLFESAAQQQDPEQPEFRAADLVSWATEDGRDVSKARTALRYTPTADAFFRGTDPLALVEKLPGLVALRVSPRTGWPPSTEFSPYDCNLVIEALFSTARIELERQLVDKDAQITWQDFEPAAPGPLGPEARAILEEQLRFLRTDTEVSAEHGRTASAARVALNVFAAAGLSHPSVASAAALHDRHGLAVAIEAALASREPAGASEPVAPVTRDASASTIRVDVARIDHIVNLTGEILVVKNAIGHWARMAANGADAETLAAALRAQHDILARHLADLQGAAFNLRVLPMDRVFSRFPRLVRETAATLGKQARLVTEGEDTRADKVVVEALFEPLLHIVRNALDHGIETPAERHASGKPAEATLLLRAFREADQVIVELEDDGRGIDLRTIRRLAIERGVVDAAAAAQMSDEQAALMVFAPGFSTAATVTDLSGRGVGMGAVRSAIERVGGEVSLVNRPGRGLTVRLVLPFTIALTKIMTLEAGGQTFGLPFDAIVETVRIPRTSIRPLGQGRAVVLRDRTIPVIDLAQTLDLPAAAPRDTACLLVIWAAGQDAALEIDRPGERLDMMMKPAEGILAGMPAIAGTSLTGDGKVLIILDPRALLK